MIGRGIRVAACLAIGGAALAGLYWLFLNTPESNALMLAGSAALIILMVAVLALVVNTAVLLTTGERLRVSVARAATGVHWFLLGTIPIALAWWALSLVDAWVSAHAGEINAWFIARFGWADVSRVLQAELWLSRWIRWVLVPLASLSLLGTLLTRTGKSVERGWLRRAWHWRTLGFASIVFVVLMVLPWRLSTWRPELPATWVQPAVAALKLGAVFVLWSIGGAMLVALSVSRKVSNP